MNLKDILSISGRTGLYKLNTQTRAGVVATSITDGKTIISSAAERISMLSEVNIYCIGKEISLTEVFEKMLVFESGAATKIKHNASSSDLEAYFFEIFHIIYCWVLGVPLLNGLIYLQISLNEATSLISNGTQNK